jgi:hypothetical protein
MSDRITDILGVISLICAVVCIIWLCYIMFPALVDELCLLFKHWYIFVGIIVFGWLGVGLLNR